MLLMGGVDAIVVVLAMVVCVGESVLLTIMSMCLLLLLIAWAMLIMLV